MQINSLASNNSNQIAIAIAIGESVRSQQTFDGCLSSHIMNTVIKALARNMIVFLHRLSSAMSSANKIDFSATRVAITR